MIWFHRDCFQYICESSLCSPPDGGLFLISAKAYYIAYWNSANSECRQIRTSVSQTQISAEQETYSSV